MKIHVHVNTSLVRQKAQLASMSASPLSPQNECDNLDAILVGITLSFRIGERNPRRRTDSNRIDDNRTQLQVEVELTERDGQASLYREIKNASQSVSHSL